MTCQKGSQDSTTTNILYSVLFPLLAFALHFLLLCDTLAIHRSISGQQWVTPGGYHDLWMLCINGNNLLRFQRYWFVDGSLSGVYSVWREIIALWTLKWMSVFGQFDQKKNLFISPSAPVEPPIIDNTLRLLLSSSWSHHPDALMAMVLQIRSGR